MGDWKWFFGGGRGGEGRGGCAEWDWFIVGGRGRKGDMSREGSRFRVGMGFRVPGDWILRRGMRGSERETERDG